MCERIMLDLNNTAVSGLTNIVKLRLEKLLKDDPCSFNIFWQFFMEGNHESLEELISAVGESVVNSLFVDFMTEESQRIIDSHKNDAESNIEPDNGNIFAIVLQMIRSWDPMDLDGLMEYIGEKTDFCSYGRIQKRSIDQTWEVATGGWSDNETVVGELEQNRMFWALNWKSSKRGGYYEFGKE